MNTMNIPAFWRKRNISSVLAVLLLSGCGTMVGNSAAEDLNLVLAGMDGSDAVSFEGAAALLVGGQTVSESELYYGGKIEDHNKVSLYTLLPDEAGGTRTAADNENDLEKLEQSSAAAPACYTRLEKKDGEWQLRPASVEPGEDNPLTALNPLRQLEELEQLEKEVTEESGAAGGSKVLRIKLTPQEARRQLVAELEQEMEAIRPEEGRDSAGQRAEVKAAMNDLWSQKENELQQKLAGAEISSVYFLKVDSKRNLPKRLTWTRTVSYPGSAQPAADETYVTKVDFYGYR